MSKRGQQPESDHDNATSSKRSKHATDRLTTCADAEIWNSITLDDFSVKALFQYIRSGGDVNIANADGYGLLYLAARNESTEAMRMLLLQPGVAVEAVHGPNRELALHASATAGHVDAVELLLEHGSPHHIRDALGHTPLTSCLFSQSIECLGLLLDAGADMHVKDEQGNTLLHLAAINGFAAAVDRLDKIPVDERNARGLSPLAVAIGLGHVETMQRLLARGADVNGTTRLGNTILHHAVTWNRIEAVKAVVDAGGNVNVLNAMEETPLMLAVQQRKIDMVRYLMDHGANPCVVDNTNMPLMYAANHGYTEMCDLLITSDTTDFFIQSAAELSERVNQINTNKLLLARLQERKQPTAIEEDTDFSALINMSDEDEEQQQQEEERPQNNNSQDNNNTS
ncbi:hypothetical protein O0I10_011577 [Lichtheimia ornata]|uniref:protein S-acyltransferase n=1 Tax=Lichtheimia ornata TaxID=688661 RepID=A0AAD7UUA6_9FUNG|nr:uncharacterized protein O0I10_011577 [Lichtheimia ornata]KAJ8652772.1 hypothetical protein O0I10_011577 [Lichtheimia ornata]